VLNLQGVTDRARAVGSLSAAAKRSARALVTAAISVAVVLAGWIAFLHVFNVSTLIGKTPGDVWHYLFSGSQAGSKRSHLIKLLNQTLTDAGLGYAVGLSGAALLALAFVLFRPVEQTLLPVAIVVRSVPLVAMTPLINIVFGRGLEGTSVIAGIVVFFPTLITVSFGLRTASRQATELCQVYGAGKLMTTRKVLIPSALPALFASARISVPGAIVGAMVAEWLSSGRGLGYAMATDPNQFEYTDLWASVAVLTVTSVLLYFLLGAVESLALARFGSADDVG
jgi:ABC-type nitrate/sulfonate/bicarbonate transport system permease component